MAGGFEPSQPPYIVGPDKQLLGFTVHITIDKMANSGTFDRVVQSFHLSFEGIDPQPVAKWAYNPGTDSFLFKGWANEDQLGLTRADLVVKVNGMMRGVQQGFGGTINPAI